MADGPPADWTGLEAWLARHFADVATIDAPALSCWFEDASRDAPLLVDVRTPDEQAVSTLPRALCVAPGDAPASVLDRAGPLQAIVVYCAVGVRSSRHARALSATGRDRVFNLRGGIFDWANRGLPLAGPGGPVHRVHAYDATWRALLAPPYRAS